MAIEPRLNELKGNSRLALGFFNSIIRRIECTKPLAGKNISIAEKPDGIQIILNANVVTLNVCSNGTPSTLVVLSADS
jgi:hypothetical protein